MYTHNNREKKVRNKEKGSQLSNIIIGLIRKDKDFEFF